MDMNSDARAIVNRWRTEKKLTERRILRFHEQVNLRLEDLFRRTVTDTEPLNDWQIRHTVFRDIDEYEHTDADWRTIHVGDTWGGKDQSAFFRRDVTIPQRMAGRAVYLRIYVGGDSLIRLNGEPHHGLDPFRQIALLTPQAHPNGSFEIELESYIHWYTRQDHYNTFQVAELVTVDAQLEAAYWDLVAAFKVLFVEDLDSSLQAFLEHHLWETLRAIPWHERNFATFKEHTLDLCTSFREAVYESERFKTTGLLHLVGHSHLDIVYMWPYREYIRKVGRTHSTMLRLMEQYPDFLFSQSSAKIYADMKEHYPAMFREVQQRVAEGRWQPVGAFWLEPDCNVISGESFVRHILYGQQFWQTEFDFQSRVCWMPDVFGMTWAMPQILKRSGVDVVMSNKFFIWNDTNPWRKNTFWWQGADGSKVLTVVPPGHFIGMVDPDHMNQFWRDFSDKESVGETIYIYGWGDGGGGVDPEMLECAARYTDFPGVVPTQFSNPEDALLQIAERAADANLPVWQDEMYLEAHRGTYTTKGRLKKLNRQSEIVIQQVEILAALAWGSTGAIYPKNQLKDLWIRLLNTQFHDALPGTHITEVYRELLDDYAALAQVATSIQQQVCDPLFQAAMGKNLLVFNPTLQARLGIVSIPGDWSQAIAAPTQSVTNLDDSQSTLVYLEDGVPSLGYRVFEQQHNKVVSVNEQSVYVEDRLLENDFLRAEFANNGELIFLWDKEAERSVLLEGEVGNKFQLYEDDPGIYDAWDIVASYVQHELPIVGESSLTIDETGPLRASLKLVRQCYDSTITQRISLCANSRALTFETEVDWHERQRLLKVGFPIAVQSRQATYDIAYGNMERPTHRNTSHDAARFEVPGHWWMDLSESDYGVALLNDSKYGHEANGHWMRQTLLRGSIIPDPVSDIEVHHFTYVLLPHLGDWRGGEVMEAATRLNVPLTTSLAAIEPSTHSYLACDAPNVQLEAMKQSENGEYLILRLTEQHNKHTRALLTFDRAITHAYQCDLMENIEQEIPLSSDDNHALLVELSPYEIVTIAIQ